MERKENKKSISPRKFVKLDMDPYQPDDIPPIHKKSHQLRALFRKTAVLQLRQKTNVIIQVH